MNTTLPPRPDLPTDPQPAPSFGNLSPAAQTLWIFAAVGGGLFALLIWLGWFVL